MREGTRVDRYMRGEGKAPKQIIGVQAIGGSRWRVSRGGSSITVGAGNIVQALSRGVDTLQSSAETITVQRI